MTLRADCPDLHKKMNKTFELWCPSSFHTATFFFRNCENPPSFAWRTWLQSN